MKEEISLEVAMTKEEMSKIKELLTSSPGLRHYAFKLENGEYLDLVEHKDYEKLQEENKSLQSQLKAKEEELKYTIPIVEHNKIVSEKNKQIKQLEEVIKEAREYIDTKVVSNGEIIDQLRIIEVKKLLEILSKGENK